MSQLLISNYLKEIDLLKKTTGSSTEGVISEAFKDLLKAWSKQQGLVFSAQFSFQSPQKTTIRPDGTIFHSLGVPFGYWEAKDTDDKLDVEIAAKIKKGYPRDNIIYENSEVAVLFQNTVEVMRCSMQDTHELARLLVLFFGYERLEIREFRKAIEQFKTDLPFVLEALRDRISQAYATNKDFKTAAIKFLGHARDTINPSLTEDDVREMLIQHILTEEIFANVFNDSDFHKENNIAKELYGLEGKFFTGGVKKDTLAGLAPYYTAIKSNAAQIGSHGEKQTFLKVIYENFYKVYNPKAADRLGVVYTPNEIVKFMIQGTDWLCEKHFGKRLIDKGVEILDPATGTGTFICELLEHFRGEGDKLAYKYKNELHANEVAILPYYVANLNIEATYAAITGQYAEFPNLCFVDTLDNVAGLGIKTGHQIGDLFGAMSDENIARVKRQNGRKISIVIGNPPYNANQANENDNNKNRVYKHIDFLIKDSYIRRSTAQKTKLYDMYARFFRWASDRLHDDGVLAFVTNRSFIDARTFDGFRKTVAGEFNEIYVVDLGGDVRANPKLSGTKNNVFGIQTGVAISFFVKRHKAKGCKVMYARRPEEETKDDKLAFLGSDALGGVAFDTIVPDKKGNWVNQTDNDWDELLQVADKGTKGGKSTAQDKSVFKLFSFGQVTARDEWVYARKSKELQDKIVYLRDAYDFDLHQSSDGAPNKLSEIKWTRSTKKKLAMKQKIFINPMLQAEVMYRPFDRVLATLNFELIEMPSLLREVFGADYLIENQAIVFSDPTSQKPFMIVATNAPMDMHIVGAAAGAVALPLYRYSKSGERFDNITDWGLNQFVKHYGKSANITKDAIFNYVYGVLHDPVYRETYAINLKRDFPRVPFYPDFKQWATWGEALMALHIGYEKVEPWPLDRTDVTDIKAGAVGQSPKPFLKALKEKGAIILDSETTLAGIPLAAWTYKLGNRSGLEWVLDQHKEKTPKDKTIREKFNTYRFADYKEKVVDLLMRVARVSVETMAIVEAMKVAKR
jgi:predicted helicase